MRPYKRQHWWYPLPGSSADREVFGREVRRGAHVCLLVPQNANKVRRTDLVWFYAGRPMNRPLAVGVVQTPGYRGTDDKAPRVVVALRRDASDWLGPNVVGLSTSNPSHAPRRALQEVHRDDARRLEESGVARFL